MASPLAGTVGGYSFHLLGGCPHEGHLSLHGQGSGALGRLHIQTLGAGANICPSLPAWVLSLGEHRMVSGGPAGWQCQGFP